MRITEFIAFIKIKQAYFRHSINDNPRHLLLEIIYFGETLDWLLRRLEQFGEQFNKEYSKVLLSYFKTDTAHLLYKQFIINQIDLAPLTTIPQNIHVHLNQKFVHSLEVLTIDLTNFTCETNIL